MQEKKELQIASLTLCRSLAGDSFDGDLVHRDLQLRPILQQLRLQRHMLCLRAARPEQLNESNANTRPLHEAVS